MKVLILANFGMGLYKFRKELIQELVKLNYEVYVSFPKDEYVPLITELGCKYIETDVDRRGTKPIKDFKLLLSYVKHINEIEPDIVLTYTVKPNIYGGIACRITKTPYLSNITGLGTAIENEGLMQRVIVSLYKIGLKKAECIFFQNEPNMHYFIDEGIIGSNTKVIPGSGVNLSEYEFEDYPESDGVIRFLFIGRIMKAKGINELLEAAIRIRERYSNVEFDLIGFCEEEYSKQLIELDEAGIINYHGQQNEVHENIKNSHATILPSYHEGTANVLLESASTGRPILASNVTGCKETFDEGISGLGFESKSVDALFDSIIDFIELPHGKKKEMGLASRKKMEQEYDRRIIINAYLEQIKRQRGINHELVQ